MNVSIIGVTGYSGLELLRMLDGHPHFKVNSVHSSTKKGQSLRSVIPRLDQLSSLSFKGMTISEITDNTELVFLAVPSGVSKEIVPELLSENIKIIDLSGDMRLKNGAEYEKWYGLSQAPQSCLDEAIYGLTEWNRPQIREARLISNPGCYPTASLLALAPLLKNKAIDPSNIIIDAKSGVSGAGKYSSEATHYANVNENLSIYKVHKHQHIPEIEQQLAVWEPSLAPIMFTTHLIPMTRGIMVTIYGNVSKMITEEQMKEMYQDHYRNEPFVRVRPAGQFPQTKDVSGTNLCDIGFQIDTRTGKVTIVAVIDNLIKGAAGQAIQNANVMMGFEEAAGLQAYPLFP